MDQRNNLNYKKAGVDISAGNAAVEKIKKLVKKTLNKNVLGKLGHFGGCYKISPNKILVSACDGVGTKLKVALLVGKHDTIGIDLVAMNADDVVCLGAAPLFFLDYIACNKVSSSLISSLIKGMVAGCRQAGCALIGGEIAEMGDFYSPGAYDLAGFTVGIVERNQIVDGSRIKPGDKIIGLPSSGLHSNGYSLVRKLFFDLKKIKVNKYFPELEKTLGEELLIPTKIYSPSIMNLLKRVKIKGISHITGGGLVENIRRILPKGTKATIHQKYWDVNPVFSVIETLGKISKKEMYKTFNMGIGMALFVSEKNLDRAIRVLKGLREKAYVIGEIGKGKTDVFII